MHLLTPRKHLFTFSFSKSTVFQNMQQYQQKLLNALTRLLFPLLLHHRIFQNIIHFKFIRKLMLHMAECFLMLRWVSGVPIDL